MVSILRPKEYLAKKNSALKLGDAVTHDLTHNCVTCVRWSGCKDPRKAFTFRCSRFNENSIDNSTMDDPHNVANFFGLAQPESLLDKAEVSEYDAQIEQRIDEMIAAALAENSPIPPDLKIQDSSIPRAPNYFTWLMDERFAGGPNSMPPFPRQIYVGSLLFGEHCPRCSDMQWFDNMKVDAKLSRIEERVVFLHKGVCPKCAVDRGELVEEGEILNPFELSLICGQRSTKTSSILLMEGYNHHRFLKLPSPSKVYRQLTQQMFTSTYTSSTFGQVKANVWDPFLNMINSVPWFTNYHKFLANRGRELGEELAVISEIFVRYKHRNLFISPASPSGMTMRGRCLVGSTMVNTNAGFVTLTELIRSKGQHPVKDIVIDSPLGQKQVSHTYKAKDKTIKIETRNGYSVEGTYEHPMLILTPDLQFKWVTLDELRIGDFIVSRTDKNQPMFGNNKELTSDLATITGYLIANGYKSTLSSNDAKVVKRFCRAAKRVTGFYPNRHGSGGFDEKGRQKAANYMVRTNAHKGDKGRPSFRKAYLQPLGFNYTNSYDKEIPVSVRTAPKHVLHEFLEAYFECDCGINGYWDDPSGVQRPASIDISSASKKLIDQLHVILLHAYGIVGRKTFSTPKNRWTGELEEHREHWNINLTGHDAWMFLQTFKRAKVQKYANRIWHVSPGDHSDRRLVPWVRKMLFETYTKARHGCPGAASGFIKLANGNIVRNNLKPQVLHTLSRCLSPHAPQGALYEDDWQNIMPRLTDLNDKAAKRLKKVLQLAAHYEEVVSIKHKTKKKTIYDVTVPEGHAFTANGLSSHNTRWTAFIDEISHMPLQRASGKEAVKANAKDTYVALRNSLDTLIREYEIRFSEGYYDLPKPMMYNASSPLTRNDYGMTLLRQSKVSEKMLGLLYPTWEFNPKLPRSYFDDRFRTNPVIAARDYGCQPPIGTSNWISDTQSIEKAFGAKRNMFTIKPYTFRSKSQKKMTSAYLEKKFNPQLNWGCILALDIGAVNNSFAFSVGTVDNDFDLLTYVRSRKQEEMNDDDSDQGVETGLVPLRVIFSGEIIPRRDAEISQHRVYRDVLSLLINELPIELVISDRWQNKKLVQDMEAEFGIEYVDYQLNWEDFENFKSGMYERKVVLPKLSTSLGELAETVLDNYPHMFENKPIDHLAYQFLTVQEARGNTVVKGDATDDMFRTIALLHAAMQDTEMLESLLNVEEESAKTPALGVVLSNNSAGSSGQTMMLKPRGHASPIAFVSRSKR